MTTILPGRLIPLAALAVLGACGPDSREVPSGLQLDLAADRKSSAPPRFSDWSAPVNLGPPVNTALVENGPSISRDGLTLHFQCTDCPGGFGGTDIWVSQRASSDEPWEPPQNLGPTINTAFNESGPSLSGDGHRLYFVSTRPGGFGLSDVYVARRRDKRDEFGWQEPVNLGSGVNTSANEAAPQRFEDGEDGTVTLFFQSTRPGGIGGSDIYASTLQQDETFGPAELVAELSSSSSDQASAIRRDGLEFFLASDRPGTVGQLDLWVSTRSRTSDPWSPPVNLGSTVNHAFIDAGTELSFDGTALYFHSANRPGNVGGPFFDLWVTTRSRVHGPE